jgi:hypothetical protein
VAVSIETSRPSSSWILRLMGVSFRENGSSSHRDSLDTGARGRAAHAAAPPPHASRGQERSAAGRAGAPARACVRAASPHEVLFVLFARKERGRAR